MRLFFLLPRVPYPTEKGDKLRAFHQIKQLSKHHEIIICALNDGVLHQDAIHVLKKYASAVYVIEVPRFTALISLARGLFSTRPLQVGYFYNRNAAKKINQLIADHQTRSYFLPADPCGRIC